MKRLLNWLRDAATAVREIAKAVAYSRSHPNEPPKHD